MASLFVNGPAHIFLKFPNFLGVQTAPVYLGTTESTPSESISPQYDPVYNDMAGSVPMDRSYQGRSGVVSCDFTRWNEGVYAAAVTTSPSGLRGFDTSLDIGALMLTEGYCPSLYVVYPFAIKAVYQNAKMPPGVRFPAAILEQEGLPQGGTKPKKVRLVWHCIPVLTITAGPGSTIPAVSPNGQFGILNYGFLLYDNLIPANLTIN